MIITIGDWLKENPAIMCDRTGSSHSIPLDELPELILNPIIYKYWYNNYYDDLDLYTFLSIIQDAENDYDLHITIEEELSELGVIIGAVGGGEISNNIFELIQGKHIESRGRWKSENWIIPINPILASVVGGGGRVELRTGVCVDGWWMAPNLFVIYMEDDPFRRYGYINWINDDPFEVK